MMLTQGKLLIFWDYDTQWGADRSRLPGRARQWGNLDFECTDRLLEIHQQYQIPACFAVVGAAAMPGERPYHDPRQIQRIAEMGHEVASHTMHHEWIPGLGRGKLGQTLRESKDALEQCLGKPVVSFVPPYNQPFDYPSRFSISLSERREARKERVDLSLLCQVLDETGYLFSRVSYVPLGERLSTLAFGKRDHGPSKLETISNITCVRQKIGAGFQKEALALLEASANGGSIAVVYGHPHALYDGGPQGERYLIPFLETAQSMIASGRLLVVLPRDLV